MPSSRFEHAAGSRATPLIDGQNHLPWKIRILQEDPRDVDA